MNGINADCVAVMCSSPSSVEMDEIRRKAQSVLSISGSAQDVRTEVLTMANTSLPLSEKYQHIEVETILRENTEGNNSQEVNVNCHQTSVCTFSNQCHILPLEGRKHPNSDMNKMSIFGHHRDNRICVITHPALNSTCQVRMSLSRLVKAFSILEKYGCNLTSPGRPRFWRSVKHNNPVFRTTVDAVKVGKHQTR